MAVTQADLERVYGVENIRVWSNLEPDVDASEGADTSRIADAITAATNEVNDMFRPMGYYALPLPTTNSTIRDWIATKAGVWLFSSRPSGGGDAAATWADKVEQVDIAIERYQSRAREFGSDVPQVYGGATMPYVVRGDGGRGQSHCRRC